MQANRLCDLGVESGLVQPLGSGGFVLIVDALLGAVFIEAVRQVSDVVKKCCCDEARRFTCLFRKVSGLQGDNRNVADGSPGSFEERPH